MGGIAFYLPLTIHHPMDQNNKLANLDAFRAIACWAVCLYHAAFILSIYYPALMPVLDWGQEGVYAFFVISALVLSWSMAQGNYQWPNFGKFLMKRFIRLYPPLIVSILLWLAYFQMGNGSLTKEVINAAIDSTFMLVPFKGSHWINNLYWTIFVLFEFYIFQALAYPLLANSNAWIRRISLVITLSLTFIQPLFLSDFKDIKILLFFHLPIFSMGLLLFLYLKKIIGATEFIIEFLLAMLACAILTGYVYGMGYHILIAATLTCLGILFVKSPPNWLSFIGKISYSFYLVHGVVIYTTIYYLPKFKESTSGSLITFLLIQAIAIFVSWLFYLAVEKPSSGWGKKINYVKKD